MKVTLFTANQSRHNYFTNLLLSVVDSLFVIQESRTIFPGIVPGNYVASETMKKYFSKVTDAQEKMFGNSYILGENKNINLLSLQNGDLSRCSVNFLSDFLKSDVYVVFGSSYIKGELVDFLVKHKALNIHMGVSPYYRGTDCNFWALYDSNPHLVGATIHLLSKGLDSGPMLYHALSEIKSDPFLYTMSTVKSAFYSIAERVKNETIFDYSLEVQDRAKEIRYTKKSEFTDEHVKNFFDRKINLDKKFQLDLLKDPFFLQS